MPWIRQEDCVSCGECVERCPVDAIAIAEVSAAIDMASCIRCGLCHGICPTDAIRHDSERVQEWVEANVTRATDSMDLCERYLGSEAEKWKCLDRMINHFDREMKIAAMTVERLRELTKA
ncbi:4Fe-4S binding protein [Candidatus Fermentibacterales bacterium]|nr:4Fe-4S binding protein [Candidatus Fermentibacterales bacterium]